MHIIIISPKYDGREHAAHARSIRRAEKAALAEGWTFDELDVSGCPVLPRVRNQLVAEALLRGADELVFVDSDIAFSADTFRALVKRDCDIVAAAPQARLSRWGEGARLCWQPKPGVVHPDDNGLLEANGVATGFMKVRRGVFERIAELGLARSYVLKEADPRSWPFLRRYFSYDLIPAQLDVDPRFAAALKEAGVPEEQWFIDEGEDFYFCRMAREAGFQVFVDCDAEVIHHEGRMVLDFSLKRAAELQRQFHEAQAAQHNQEQGEDT